MKNKSAILFGNGLNLLSENNVSWDQLLKGLATVNDLPSSSNTLNFECILLNKCRRFFEVNNENSFQIEYDIKKQIAELCGRFKSNSFYDKLVNLPVDVYLTTNYDSVLDNVIKKAGYVDNVNDTNKAETIYSIRRCHAFTSPMTGVTKRVFPIHGEHEVVKSIMIGYDHYCGSLGKIDDYFKGQYSYTTKEKQVKLPRLSERLRDLSHIDSAYRLGLYWPDYFFTHDIHMIGLGMQLVETDLWWILNKRARMQVSNKEISNNIYYYGNTNKEVERLLEFFGVKIIPVTESDNWNEKYNKMFKAMMQNINR